MKKTKPLCFFNLYSYNWQWNNTILKRTLLSH